MSNDTPARLTIRERMQIEAGPKRAVAAPRPDPRRQEVFQRGPDGKLHPVPGYKITGPFDFATWGRNIDWRGVGKDFLSIAAGVASQGGGLVSGGVGAAGVVGRGIDRGEAAVQAGTLYQQGEATVNELGRCKCCGKPQR